MHIPLHTLFPASDHVFVGGQSFFQPQVLQTCLRSSPGFEGLLLCTPSGVMNKDYTAPMAQMLNLYGICVPTFALKITEMEVHIPYMDHMG